MSMSNARYNVERALAALTETVGESIPLDDSGQCGLLFDSEVEIVIAYGDDSSVLSLRAPLTGPAPLSTDTLHAALAQNYGQLPSGYCVALDPDSGQLMMMLVLTEAPLVTYEEFLERIADMVALVPEVRERLA